MSETRENPFSHRPIEVADDGSISTWVVTWEGQESVARRYLSDERELRLKTLRKKYGHLKRWSEEESKEGFISNRSTCFVHYDEAESEYNWIKNILVKRGDWEVQKAYLLLIEGERCLWADLFEEPGIYNWMA